MSKDLFLQSRELEAEIDSRQAEQLHFNNQLYKNGMNLSEKTLEELQEMRDKLVKQWNIVQSEISHRIIMSSHESLLNDQTQEKAL